MGSGPHLRSQSLWGKPPCGAFCQDSHGAGSCNLVARTTHDYFCGRVSSAALRWPRAQENIGFEGFKLEWGSRTLHKKLDVTVVTGDEYTAWGRDPRDSRGKK